MKRTQWIRRLIIPLTLLGAVGAVQAQGKGYGGEQKPAKAQGRGTAKQDKPGKAAASARADKPGKAIGRTSDKPQQVGRGRSEAKRAEVREFGGDVGRPDVRTLSSSNKHGQRLAGRAVSKATKRGVSEDDFLITPSGRRVEIRNRSGDLLLDLDDDRDLGRWRVVSARETGKRGSPSFCRSGAGHPVWGRQWCVDKGFGLGVDQGVRWSRAVDLNDVIFRRRVTTDQLARNVLLDVIGDVVFNRLATQAITLGYVEPLTGRWIGEPVGPRVLLVSSGARPVAEIVDINRDDRADMLIVATRP